MYIIEDLPCLVLQLRKGADDIDALTRSTLPYWQRRAPKSRAAYRPIFEIAQPFAEASFANVSRFPGYFLVLANEVVLYARHRDVPRIARVVEKRCFAAPAEWVRMRDSFFFEKESAIGKVGDDISIRVFYELSRKFSGFGHKPSVFTDEMILRQTNLRAKLKVVDTVHHGGVHDTSTVFRRNEICSI